MRARNDIIKAVRLNFRRFVAARYSLKLTFFYLSFVFQLTKTPTGVSRMELVEKFSLDADIAKTILSGKTHALRLTSSLSACLQS